MLTGATLLTTARERRAAAKLLESLGLRFEEPLDDLVGIYDEGRLVASAARAGIVLKMFAIDPALQGTEVLGELATALMQRGREAGEETFFIYTRPESATSFEHLNFRLLVSSGTVSLLEYGPGIESYLRERSSVIVPGLNGASVINGNPFTLGHLYLVENAAREVDRFYLFVVREDRSVFPFAVRRRLADEATAHLRNVTVVDTSRYAVSAGTFPSYFLRRLDDRAREQMQIDVRIFGKHLAPAFSIRTRFVGQEPYCQTTAAYNRTMAAILPEYGVELREIARRPSGADEDRGGEARFISATDVRAAFLRGDFETVARLVPAPTLEFLRSAEGEEVRRKLAARQETGT